jgi:hypothetical protein
MTAARPSIGADDRRARLAVRHHVAPATRVESVVEAARGVVCLHATDPATVYLSTWARTRVPSVSAIDQALYVDRELVRMLAMRRTMFVVPTEDAPILHAAASLDVARTERRRNEALAGELGVDDPAAWLTTVRSDALAALDRRGEATAQELVRDVPELARKVRVSLGKRYEGDVGMSSRVLLLLALDGEILRGRPRGTWLSSQYRWTTVARWLGHPLSEVPVDAARAELVSRWLGRFGPGTEADLRWWTGWTLGAVRGALASVGAVEVDIDGAIGLALPDDLEPTPTPDPWVALLPALDPTTMGWQARDWYLGPHRAQLFDRNGNAGPTVWVDGRVVGGWATDADGQVRTRQLEDVGREAAAAIDEEAARLTAWLDGVKVVPRFASPPHHDLLV